VHAMDTLTHAERSKRMGLIRGVDTKPELRVRSIVHRCGYRYRLHVSRLPGKPDLVFPRMRKVIFVHGCFWHRHTGCKFSYTPKTRTEFWLPKFERNVARDRVVTRTLRKHGWRVVRIWECQLATKKRAGVLTKLRSALATPARPKPRAR